MVEGILSIVGDNTGEADNILANLEQYTLDLMKLSEENADYIDNLLKNGSSTNFMMVDREMLKQSMEAWIHVLVNQPEFNKNTITKHIDGHIYGFGRVKGILTWSNSD